MTEKVKRPFDPEEFLKHFKTADGKPYEIPPEGSLGLLALGDVGVMAWKLSKINTHKQNNAV